MVPASAFGKLYRRSKAIQGLIRISQRAAHQMLALSRRRTRTRRKSRIAYTTLMPWLMLVVMDESTISGMMGRAARQQGEELSRCIPFQIGSPWARRTQLHLKYMQPILYTQEQSTRMQTSPARKRTCKEIQEEASVDHVKRGHVSAIHHHPSPQIPLQLKARAEAHKHVHYVKARCWVARNRRSGLV